MSLTKVTNSMISDAAANVVDYGADPTGGVDSTSAFVQALTASKNVFIPEGTFLIDTVFLGDVHGYNIVGASTTATVLKGKSTATKVLDVAGSTTGGVNTYNTFKNFSIDMSLMDSVTVGGSIGIRTRNTWGNSFYNVNVLPVNTNQRALLIDQHTYTSTFDNCDFGGVNGVVEIEGYAPPVTYSVTTLTFTGCSFTQCFGTGASAITFLQPIVQGTLNKFQIDTVSGFSIIGGDIEGSGTYLVFGADCNNVLSMNNALVGFAGTYTSGTLLSGQLIDQINGPYKLINGGGTRSTLEANGMVDEILPLATSARKYIKATNATSQTVDIDFNNANGDTYVGMTATGDTYVDGRGTGKVTLQNSGVDRVGVTGANQLYLNTATAPTAGSLVGYVTFTNGTTTYKIPYYAV